MDLFEQDVDQVVSRLSRQVGDGAGSVPVVRALDLGLCGALHGQAQTSGTSALGVNGELCWAANQTPLQTRAGRFHLQRNVAKTRVRKLPMRDRPGIRNWKVVLYLAGVWRQLGVHREGTSRDSVSIVGHIDGMDSLLCGGVMHHLHVGFTRLRLHFTRHHLLVGT